MGEVGRYFLFAKVIFRVEWPILVWGKLCFVLPSGVRPFLVFPKFFLIFGTDCFCFFSGVFIFPG